MLCPKIDGVKDPLVVGGLVYAGDRKSFFFLDFLKEDESWVFRLTWHLFIGELNHTSLKQTVDKRKPKQSYLLSCRYEPQPSAKSSIATVCMYLVPSFVQNPSG